MPLSTVDLSTSSLPKTWFLSSERKKLEKSLKIAALVHSIIATFYAVEGNRQSENISCYPTMLSYVLK